MRENPKVNAVISALYGGLGNQMFLYACYIVIRSRYMFATVNSYEVRRFNDHQGYELERVFDIPDHKNLFIDGLVRFVRKCIVCKDDRRKFIKYPVRWLIFILNHIGFHIIYRDIENRLSFDPKLLQERFGLTFYVDGCWSEKFFKGYEASIREIFRFNSGKLNPCSVNTKRKIEKCNSVSLHIRRGDFLEETILSFGGVCTLDYYKQAVNYICEKVDSPVFFVFSDDMEWAKKKLHLSGEVVFIDWNKGKDSWQDMCLMSYCKHNINANSTFSWWGAWLNTNPHKIVVVPSIFHRLLNTPDFYPDSWIKISEYDREDE